MVFFDLVPVHAQDLDLILLLADHFLRLVDVAAADERAEGLGGLLTGDVLLTDDGLDGGPEGGVHLFLFGLLVVELAQVAEDLGSQVFLDRFALLIVGDETGIGGAADELGARGLTDGVNAHFLAALGDEEAGSRREMPVAGKDDISVRVSVHGRLVDMVKDDKIGKILDDLVGGVLGIDDGVGHLTDVADLGTQRRIGKVAEKRDVQDLIAVGKLVPEGFDIRALLVKLVKRNVPMLKIDESNDLFLVLGLVFAEQLLYESYGFVPPFSRIFYVQSFLLYFFLIIPATRRHRAAFAFRLAGVADVPTEAHDAVAEIRALLGGQQLPQGHLGADGILFAGGGQSQPCADADAMGIGNDGGQPVHVPQQQVGDLPPHPGEAQQLLHGVRQHPAVFLSQHPALLLDGGSLGAVKPAGLHDLLDAGEVSFSQRLCRGKFPEQRLADDIHPLVGALGGKPPHHHQLPWLLPVL